MRTTDAGVYWCIVGTDRANLTLKFHSLDDALALAHQRLQLVAAEGHHDACLLRYLLDRFFVNTKKDVGSECRRDIRPSLQLPQALTVN